MEFRKDINGLRALAVIAVVLFHFDSSWLPGGFAGVDVFFVISGYLMTGIIFSRIHNGSFRAIDFYKSRAKRILPALSALCLTILIFGWFYLGNSDYLTLTEHSLGSLLFFSNFSYWSEAGYFDAVSTSKWLLHTWSLSVEWQFYLVYPLLVISLVKLLSYEGAKKTIILLFATLFPLSIILTLNWPDASYYLLPTRSWEMLLGGIVFLFPLNIRPKHETPLFLTGLLLILISFMTVSAENYWPGYLAMAPVAGTALILYSQKNSSFLFGNRWSQAIGRWSYSIYLWHWPVVAFLYFNTASLSMPQKLTGIAVSILFGALSYHLIETRRNYRKLFALYAAVIVFCSANLWQSEKINEFRDLTAQYERKDWVEIYSKRSYVPGGTYWFACNAARHLVKTGELGVDEKCIANKGSGGVVLWGDSHAGALSEAISSALKDGVPYNQLASTACAASWNEELYESKESRGKPRDIACNYQNDLMKDLVRQVHPGTVIIVQARHHERRHLVATAVQLKEMGVQNVILVGPVPQWKPSLPQVLSKKHETVEGYLVSPSFNMSAFKSNEGLKAQLSERDDIEFVDIIGQYCFEHEGELACKYKADNENLMTFDYGHPTQEGAALIVEELLKPKLNSTLTRG